MNPTRRGSPGPRLDAALALRGVAGAGVGRAGLEVLGQRVALLVEEALADERGADDLAVGVLTKRAVGPVVEGALADGPDGQRVDDAGEHGEDDGGSRTAVRSWRRMISAPPGR